MSAIPLSEVAVHLRPEDNVAVAARNIPAGAELQHNGSRLTAASLVRLGHKVALTPIKKGAAVTKYGQLALNLEPLREDVHRHLMNAYAAVGRIDLAESQFERCRLLLRQEVDPG